MLSVIFLFTISTVLASASWSHQYCYSTEEIEHGFVEVAQEHYYKFSCENGYRLHGSTYIPCHEYSQTIVKPKCIENVCKDPGNPQNGQVVCDEGPLFPGKKCYFTCFDGYQLQGYNKISCTYNLQWTGSATCSPERRRPITVEICEMPPSVENGEMECDKGALTLGKTCRFKCLDGYKLQGTNVRRCMPNNRWSGNVKCSPVSGHSYPVVTDVHRKSHEDANTRANEHLRRNSCQNLRCEQLCLIEETGPLCRCCPGYVIDSDKKSCRLNNESRINMNECLRKYGKVGDVVLRPCAEGYTFDYKRNDCIGKSPHLTSGLQPSYSKSCSVNNGGCEHDCTEASQTITCKCRTGYELYRNGKNCIDIDECKMNKFDCSGICVNIPGSAYCTCPRGYTLDTDRKTCIDIDECLSENRCNHFCNNTAGSYFCSCKPGYILIEGYKCEGCRRNSYWSHERNACVDCPKNSHTDSEGKTSIKDCVCDSGFAGNPGDYISCTDVNECDMENFGCSDTCVNYPGGAYCFCPGGFMLDSDNKTCIDIDECSIKNGGCDGLCINNEGNFTCVCEQGFVASTKDRYSCDDINECSENNGGCEQLCVNYRGGFYCACKEGFHLDTTLKNCTEIQCPKVPLPHFSYMNCTYENMALEDQNKYPIGTKCTFRCSKGFKNANDGKILKCYKDGTWKGVLPECKPESCPPLKVPENGKVHPPRCSKHGATTKQKCTFSCQAGYILEGDPVFVCKNNLTWNKNDIPVCKPVKIQPKIKCPDDIQVILLQGKDKYNVTVPEPITDSGDFKIFPLWVTTNEPVEFPVGVTQVTFTATSIFNETAQCDMTVTVLDEEPPTFHFCPDPIIIEDAKSSGEFVTWDNPVVTDNVEVVSVFSLMEPNRTLTPGTYFVEYVARDSSGNVGTCSFEISIARMNCSDLKDPINGKANCMDWMFGKLCNPECDDGYIRDPEDPPYYSCDDTGLWEPTNFISECLRYTLTNSTTCQDGFQLKKLDATGEEICIECPSNAVWSSTTKQCEK